MLQWQGHQPFALQNHVQRADEVSRRVGEGAVEVEHSDGRQIGHRVSRERGSDASGMDRMEGGIKTVAARATSGAAGQNKPSLPVRAA
ncbi:hypothetical protein MGN01_37900 [Methylobacterium gnaphalii]|uniref:Uncharacterized protein n=1 Tax=Methylobacterium gnaphalii TaxID=1010610 RepID=A0A512JPQ6_9HYPH|nr:hypothetical protein MGN01_37900 [Methylobacterium gnaphalii]GLS48605.1 hypothetical protein GCM10007885_14490 [Methylobacterium gnaphalii]